MSCSSYYMKLGLFVNAAAILASGSGEDMSPACLILADADLASTHESFYAEITNQCAGQVLVRDVNDKSVSLQQFGHYVFSNVILAVSDPGVFAFPYSPDPMLVVDSDQYRQSAHEMHIAKYVEKKRSDDAKQQGPGLCLDDLVDFVDKGGNLLISVQGEKSAPSETLSHLLSKFGFALGGPAPVSDYFHRRVMSSVPLKTEPWAELVGGPNTTVIYQGVPVGIAVGNKNVFSFLRATESAYHPSWPSQGIDISLAGANQALNGARVVLVGSLEMFSEDAFAKHSGNAKWISNVVSWIFRNRAVLRARDLYHHKVGETDTPRVYREKDDVVVSIKIEEKMGDKWVPFASSDVQVEYVMLDPHLRQYMRFNGIEHELQFKVPDVYGIFKFRIEYSRLGFNPILVEQVAPVRNYRHNDYDRFLFCAFPYYASSFVTMGLVLVFSVIFLNHREPSKRD